MLIRYDYSDLRPKGSALRLTDKTYSPLEIMKQMQNAADSVVATRPAPSTFYLDEEYLDGPDSPPVRFALIPICPGWVARRVTY